MAELRLPAEQKFAEELAALAQADPGPKPPQWRSLLFSDPDFPEYPSSA
jgi:hypothetical protein